MSDEDEVLGQDEFGDELDTNVAVPWEFLHPKSGQTS
jgi:hypothetical protein